MFGGASGSRPPLYIGSVKSNTGHAEAASGAAGLTKLLLMLRERAIPPQANLRSLNPRLSGMEQYNFAIARELQPWKPPPGIPRRALLNNFGAAGSNAVLIVEEFQERPVRQIMLRSSYPFITSARTSDACLRLQDQYLRSLDKRPSQDIRDICYTATARRQRYEHQFRLCCKTTDELTTKLKQKDSPKITKSHSSRAKIVFIFSGQGAIRSGMGKELLTTSPLFRELVLKCDKTLRALGYKSVLPMLDGSYIRDSYSFEDNVVIGQCACVVLEYALAQLWCSWKVFPDIVLGHR